MTTQVHKGKRSLTKTLGNYSFILIFAFILIAYLIINAAGRPIPYGALHRLRACADGAERGGVSRRPPRARAAGRRRYVAAECSTFIIEKIVAAVKGAPEGLPLGVRISAYSSSAQICLSARKARQTSTPARAMPRNRSAAPEPPPFPSRRASTLCGGCAAISGVQTPSTR